MKLILNKSKEIVIAAATKAIKETIEEVEVYQIIDTGEEVKALVSVQQQPAKVFVLWSGDTYTEIGDWTQAQANARIEEML